MAENSRENILKHEQDPNYRKGLKDWVVGKIPDISDYRKISSDDPEELLNLAKVGQVMADRIVPGTKLYFTQAVLVGAALLDRPLAKQFGLNFEKYRSVLMITPTRFGKGYAYSTPVLTTKGWKKHGDLRAGDIVFHPSGKPTAVVTRSTSFECRYTVELENGEVLETSAEHEWYVYDRTMQKTHRENGKRVIDQRGGYRIMETRELAQKNLQKREFHKNRGKWYERNDYLVDVPQPCQFPEQEQPVDPYFLGCWLGDGTKTEPVLTLSPEKAADILPHIHYPISNIQKQVGCSRYYFGGEGSVRSYKLREAGVFNDKHIPDIYKYASPAQQQALLAGLIDTDGYVDKTGRVTISSANEKLTKDILELLTIMGCCPYETIVPATTSSSGIVGKHDVHCIGFQPSYELPLRHQKLTRIVPHRRIGIVRVTENGGDKGNCIQVSSPDGLYLVGRQLIPTHNSFLNAFIAIANAAIGGKEVRIGGASRDKAGLIQEKIVELMPKTNKEIQDGLIVMKEEDVNKKVQRLATQVSKEALSWKNGGSIKLFSTNETKKNSDVAAAGAVGVGGDICVLDEIQLMSPMGFRTASRFFMENENTKRFCVGNPQINGHFKDLYDDPNTFVVHINDSGAIIEGRMSRRQMELTGMPTFSNEYRAFIMTEFPPDNIGTRFFNTLPSVFDKAKFPEPMQASYFMGIDSAYKGGDALMVSILGLFSAGGRTWSRLVYQEDMKQKYPTWDDRMTTINIALDILKLKERYSVSNASLDIGLGVHIYEALQNLDPAFPVEPVHFNSAPTEWRAETDFNAKWALNKRAEMHLDLKELCETQMFFIDEPYYDVIIKQLREIGNAQQGKKIKVESKGDIKHRLGQSPDALDSLCLAVRAMVLSGVLRPQAEESIEDMIYVS